MNEEDVTALIQFLRNRIQYDRQTATATTNNHPGTWKNDGTKVYADEGTMLAEAVHRSTAEHVVDWQPGRVLSELEAKRRIVEQFTTIELPERSDGDTAAVGAYVKMLAVLQLMAAVYVDHPDYRAAWVPKF